MTRRNTIRTISTIAALTVVAFAGCNELTEITEGTNSPSTNEAPTGSGDAAPLYNGLPMDQTEARAALKDLTVSDPRPMSGYDREEQFPHWLNAEEQGWDAPDANDCDARDAALHRDGEDVRANPETCTPDRGTWIDPYTGESLTDSGDVDIDHVVPLAAAWRSGADEWDQGKREEFANAPLATVASGASANREKGDKGPEVWKPENQQAWCPYATRWIAVKDEYGLDLTSTDERDALTEMLDTCQEG